MTEAASTHDNHNQRRMIPESEHQLGKLAAGIVIDTADRFSLVQEGYGDQEIRDVISSIVLQKDIRYKRFLIVDAAITDGNTYESLQREGIPQLPRIKTPGKGIDHKIVFGVREGLKPLINEALFSRPSSPTYVGDKEIYHQLGKLYRKAWEATGKILLNPYNPADSPMRHVAIHSFVDSNDILTLCPPYSPDTPTVGIDTAYDQFSTALQDELATHIELPVNFDQTQYLDELLFEARSGFREE